MKCPNCHKTSNKRGRYLRPSDQKIIQRFQCKNCKKSFSTQTTNFDYRLRKRKNNQMIFRLLCSGQSQRRCALLLGVKQETIARRVRLFGRIAKKNLENYRAFDPAYCRWRQDKKDSSSWCWKYCC